MTQVPARCARVLVYAFLAVLLIATTASAAKCKKVGGKLTFEAVTGSACASGVGICTTGVFGGGLSGDFYFTGTSLIQTVDTPTTSVVLLTGDKVITTKEGTLLTKDAIVLRTTGAEEYAELDTVIGGTGQWAGATGQLTITGTFTVATGGEGEYAGQVCTP